MKILRVLVVDDSHMIRNEVKRSLGPLGAKFQGVEALEFLEAADGREALALAESRRGEIHGVVCDWEMPAMDGLELVRRLRAMPGGRRLPILMLTSTSERDRVVEALHAGIDGYMVKPFDAASLVARFAGILRRDTLRILVADDSAMVRHNVVRDLRQLEARLPGLRVAPVLEAADGAQALAAVGRHRDLDLVISDWNMPEMDGLQFIESLRGDPATRDLPVIMMTAFDDRETVTRAAKAGISAYLAKPFEAGQLLDKILGLFRPALLLPAAEAPAAAPPDGGARPSGSPPANAHEPYGVLVVDDSAMVRKLVAKALEALAPGVGNLEFLEATDARQAVAVLRAGKGRSLVVANWRLPGRDGAAFVHDLLRAAEPAKPLFVVMTTDCCPATVLEELRELPVRLLPKPFDGAHLLEIVRGGGGRD